jgi:CRISPR-associated protein Csx17
MESPPAGPSPLKSEISAQLSDALQFLACETDDEALATWLDRFSLFDWSTNVGSKTSLRAWAKGKSSLPSSDAGALLYGFFRPHFDSATLASLQALMNGDEAVKGRAPNAKAGRLTSIVAALDCDNLALAWENAASSYRVERVPITDFPHQAFAHANPRRLLAALIFPVGYGGLKPLITRWQSPSNLNTREPTS